MPGAPSPDFPQPAPEGTTPLQQQGTAAPKPDNLAGWYEAVGQKPVAQTPERVAPAEQSLLRENLPTNIPTVDRFLDDLRGGNLTDFLQAQELAQDLSRRIEAEGANTETLKATRAEICSRSTALGTLSNADRDFQGLIGRRGLSLGDGIAISWTTGADFRGATIRLASARNPREHVANLRSFLEGEEYKQIQQGLGEQAPVVDSRIRLYLAEMGRLIAANPNITVREVGQVADALRKGEMPYDTYGMVARINQRLVDIAAASSCSADLAKDEVLQAERNDLLAARDEIRERFSSQATRTQAQKDAGEGFISNHIIIVYRTTDGLRSGSVRVGMAGSAQERHGQIISAITSTEYREAARQNPDLRRALWEYANEVTKTIGKPAA